MSTSLDQVNLNLPSTGFPISRLLNIVVGILAFVTISTASLFSALGYQVNWDAHSIEQTSLIELQTRFGLPADVYINGVKQADGLPLRIPWILPGQYTIEVRKDGYQSWSRIVTIDPNQRAVFQNIVLVYQAPRTVDVPVVTADDFNIKNADTSGIDIRKNELWIEGKFVTRLSQDIQNAEWFPGHYQLVYQLDNRLVLSDADGSNVQTLVTTDSAAPIPYLLQDSGRILIYQLHGTTQAVALFDKLSFIDRLAVPRYLQTP